MQPRSFKLGTRGSPLALVQSEWVASEIRKFHPDIELELVKIVTDGDRSQAANTPLSTYSEKGIFAKEIELALLNGEIDLAVHSMKDLAAELPVGLVISAYPAREDVRDVIVGAALASLPQGARVGTGSARRQALLRELRPDLAPLEIRGNIDTRLAKLDNGGYDAIVLAAAGLNRLGRGDRIAEYLDPYTFVPDPGQGALAIETRFNDPEVISLLVSLNDPDTEICVRTERAYLRALGGGCTSPVGAWARLTGTGEIAITGMSVNETGEIVRETISDSSSNPDEVGYRLAGLINRAE